MKALILAGGAGTRLRPITHTSAKQLVPVANKPILFYGLEAMAEAGIKQVGIIVGDTSREVMAAVGDGSRWGLEITFLHQAAPSGLAHCVLIAGDFLGADDFVMYLGDNLIRQGVKPFVDRFEADRRASAAPTLGGSHTAPVAQILLARVPDPQRFGVAELDGEGHVVRLVEKPAVPASDLALVGVYLFDKTIHRGGQGHPPFAPRRARDHRRHPVVDRSRPRGPQRPARRVVHRHGEVDPAARGQSPRARDPRAPGGRPGRQPNPESTAGS